VATITFLGGHGLKVPKDVSVAGYGNLEIGNGIVPPLTTVSESYSEMGAKAVKLLLASVASREICRKKDIFNVSLIVRGSTGQATKEKDEA